MYIICAIHDTMCFSACSVTRQVKVLSESIFGHQADNLLELVSMVLSSFIEEEKVFAVTGKTSLSSPDI